MWRETRGKQTEVDRYTACDTPKQEAQRSCNCKIIFGRSINKKKKSFGELNEMNKTLDAKVLQMTLR